jgi:hypothetical protein
MLLAASSAAFAPASPGFGPRHALRAAAAHMLPRVHGASSRTVLAGLRAQLGDIPTNRAAPSDKELPEITEAMMVHYVTSIYAYVLSDG